jgi:hypothetical protein
VICALSEEKKECGYDICSLYSTHTVRLTCGRVACLLVQPVLRHSLSYAPHPQTQRQSLPSPLPPPSSQVQPERLHRDVANTQTHSESVTRSHRHRLPPYLVHHHGRCSTQASISKPAAHRTLDATGSALLLTGQRDHPLCWAHVPG